MCCRLRPAGITRVCWTATRAPIPAAGVPVRPRRRSAPSLMGDPETQPIMLRLKSDLVGLVEHAINGTLDKADAEWDRRAALGVVLAAAGYPDSPRKGDVIGGLPQDGEDVHVFHAATAQRGEEIVTSGGRVLCVTALGDNIRLAHQRAYEIAEQIHVEGCQMRRDIGYRALKR